MSYKVKVYFQDSNNSYTGSTTTVTGGKIYLNGTEYAQGTTYTLSASSLILTCDIPSSSGYNFYQWKYSLNGGYSTSTSSNASYTITPSQDTVVIIWCRVSGISYSITYDYNYPDGSSGSNSGSFTYGRNNSTLLSARSFSGYTFLGWLINGTIHAPSEYFVGPASNVTAVGQWQAGVANKYSIFYFNNDSNGNTSTTTDVSQGAKVALKSAPSYNGYSFSGWEIDGTTYPAGSSFTMPDHDVRANGTWSGVEITIFFNTNSGTPGIEPMTVYSGVPFTLPSTTLTKGTNKFSGWYLNSSYYRPGETVTLYVTNSSPTTLNATAQFSTNSSITVQYRVSNSNYGTISGSTSATKTVPGTYGSLPSVTPIGDYVFAGWFDRSGYLTSREITSSTQISYYSGHTIYANFYMPVKVRLYPNNGSWADGSTDSYKEFTFKYGDTFNFPNVTRTGYGNQIGWFTSSSIYGGVEYVNGSVNRYTGTSTSTIYLYARWPQEVTFNGNNGTPASQKAYYAYGSQYSPLPSVTRDNHNFLGWFTSSSSGTQITTTNLVTTSTTRTLYAHWQLSSQTVTFDVNGEGGSVSPSSKVYLLPGTYGDDGGLPTPTRSGWEFDGWFTYSSGGTQIDNSTAISNEATRTLYAHWHRTIVSQTVSFYANGGSVSPSQKTYDYPGTYASNGGLPVPTRSNYEFVGWFTESSGGTQVQETDSVSASETRDLYAHWNLISQTVYLYANGGTVSPDQITVQYPGYYTGLPTPTRTNYRFLGWFTSSSGGTQVDDTTSVSNEDYRYLYAHWQFDKQTVYFYGNGGSVSPSSKYYTVGELYSDLPTPDRNNYHFLGWYTSSTGGTLVSDTDTVTNEEYRYLYAHWELYAQTVTFNPNGGTVNPSQTDYSYPGYYSNLPVPTLENCNFQGWFTSTSGGSKVENGNSITEEPTRILYAQWLYDKQTVTFRPNGGTVTPTSMEFSVGSTYAGMPTPTRDNATFDGWYTSQTGGDRIYESTEVPNLASRTLYAHWTFITQTVTFDSNGGEIDDADETRTYTVGQTYASLPITTRAEYYFDGWFTESTSGTEVTTSTTVTNEETRTLYAHWTPWPKVTFLPCYDDGIITTKYYIYPGVYSNLPTSTRDGYDFIGWFTAEDDSGTQVRNGDATTSTDRTLYAHWADGQTVTFFTNDDDGSEYIGIYSHNGTYSNFPTPTRDGFTFAGWFTDAAAGTQVSNGDPVTPDATRNLYAHWDAEQDPSTTEPLTIIFLSNGGRFNDNTTIKTYTIQVGDSLTIEAPIGSSAFQYYYNYNTKIAQDALTIPEVTVEIYKTFLKNPLFMAIYQDDSSSDISDPRPKDYYYTFIYYIQFGDGFRLITYQRGYYAPNDPEHDQPAKFYTNHAPTATNIAFDGVQDYLEFTGWSPSLPANGSGVTSSQTFVAQYSTGKSVVQFQDWDGTVLKTYYEKWLTKVEAPSVVTQANHRPGYRFKQWNPEASFEDGKWYVTVMKTDDRIKIYTAEYEVVKITLTFDAAGGQFPDGTTTKTVTVDYGDSLEPNQYPPNPTRQGFKFIGWDYSCTDITGDITTVNAMWADESGEDTAGGTKFGSKDADYIFVAPPSGYWTIDKSKVGIGRAEPMPDRSGDKEKILSWEDPIYLNEWVDEIGYMLPVYGGYVPQRESPLNGSTREIFISTIANEIEVDSSTNIVEGDYYSLLGRLLSHYNPWWYEYYSNYMLFYGVVYLNKFNPKNGILETSNNNNYGDTVLALLYASGLTNSMQEPSLSEWRNILVDINHADTSYGQKIQSNFIRSESQAEEDWKYLMKYPKTIYYCLQALANNIIFCEGWRCMSVKRKTTKWNAFADRSYMDDEENRIESPRYRAVPSESDNWTEPPEDPYDTNPPAGVDVYYVLERPGRESKHDPENIPNVSITPEITEAEETNTGLGFNQILSLTRYDSSYITWTSSDWDGMPSVTGWYWDDEYGSWDWTADYNEGYIVYTSRGLERRTSGTIVEASEFKFAMRDSKIVRYHNASGTKNNADYLKPVKFFVELAIEAYCYKINSSTTGGYPEYSNPDSIDYFLDNRKSYIIAMPVDQFTEMENENYQNGTVWKVKDVKSFITSVFEKTGYKDDLEKAMKIPNSLENILCPYPNFPQENKKYKVSEDGWYCGGTASFSQSYSVRISIKDITGAYIWNPWPSVGVRKVSASEC